MTAPPGSVRFSALLSPLQLEGDPSMRIIRILGSVALWIGAVLGVIAGGVWVAGQFGWVQPLIVISGSMEPAIDTGDLIIARNLATSDVTVGDVVSLHSEMTNKLVTHRVTEVTPNPDGTWQINMKGDANDEPDLETYTVGESVLTPMARIPQGGTVVSKVMEPTVAMPILLALVALLGLSLLDEEPRRVVRRVIARVRQRDPRIDQLDEELAAVGIDVERLREMDDLDLQLYALGIDIDPPAHDNVADRDVTRPIRRNGRGFEDGLWDFEMPPSDGLGLVRTPNESPPTRSTSSTPPHRSPSERDRVDHETAARSG
jgi:signal peptidase I